MARSRKIGIREASAIGFRMSPGDSYEDAAGYASARAEDRQRAGLARARPARHRLPPDEADGARFLPVLEVRGESQLMLALHLRDTRGESPFPQFDWMDQIYLRSAAGMPTTGSTCTSTG